jgi:two-component system invasion response regulator UvrY
MNGAHWNYSRAQDELTAREKQVASMTAIGMHDSQIGEKLGIKAKSVSFYRATIYDKLGLRGIALLTHWAIQHGLVRLGEPLGA